MKRIGRRIRGIMARFPLVRRRTMEAAVGRKEGECRNYRDTLKRERREHQREVEELLRPMVERFLQLRIERDYEHWQFTAAFDSSFVDSCLRHGDSDAELEYLETMIGKMIAAKVSEAIRCRNYYRPVTHWDKRSGQ